MPKECPCTGGKAGCDSRCCARRGGPCPGTGPAGQLCLRAGNAVWKKSGTAKTPVSDHEARRLLDTYKEAALENLGVDETAQRTGFAHLEPELTLVPGAQPWLRLRISDGGRQYVVKSIPET